MKYYILLPILLLTACSDQKEKPQVKESYAVQTDVALTDAEMKTAGITLGKPEKGIASTFLKVSGVIDAPPQNVVSVSFPMGGYLVATRLLPGMRVNRGQAIAEMQNGDLIQLQQDYLVARTKASFLQKEYERQKLLNATKTASDKVLEQTLSEYKTQRILANSMAQKLRLVHLDPASLDENNIRRSVMIYSPIDGYVSAVHVNTGKYVNPSDVLFELVNPKDLHLALKVFEKDLPSVHPGQKVTVNLVNSPGKTIDAEVTLVSRNLDEDRGALVHCHFVQPAGNLLPGMFANAEIETKTTEAILVPEDAVVRWGDQHYIFLQKAKDRFGMTVVAVGSINNGKTEVRSSVANLPDQNILASNAYAALMKMQNKAE